ncbi:cellulose binding domain-containing protein [Dactylosporangium sp. CA-139114]|uniref:cellulose binding domain-containing protein n=1 Tax=Dactylosporangium sp. CA-139114 TaxID=3239931 RepID=UPI003D96CDFC
MHRGIWWVRLAIPVIAAAGAALIVLALQPSARATVPEPTAPVTGNATYFDGLGAPYGGCGLPQAELETQNFVALNVFDTPGSGTFYPRPLSSADADKMGIWNNGHNCGRWVRVSIGDYCTGVNDGALGQAFCRSGAWSADAYNGGTLDMIVADSCGDSNAWCRDDKYHLDLSKDSLNRFVKNGAPMTDLYPSHWNNRHVSWQFIPAPAYSGDIKIGFLSGAQRWWPAIAVSKLPNGVHGIEYFADGAWKAATMNGDMGQSYIIGATTSGGTDFRIRVRDANDALLFNGREYAFSFPAACSSQCGQAYTQATYTTTSTSTSPSPSRSASASPSASVSVSASVSASSSASPSRSASSSPAPAGGCSAAVTTTGSWSGGGQAEVKVTNTGTAPTSAWTVKFTLPAGVTVASSWNVTLSVSGQAVTASNASYNGTVGANASTSWGLVFSGPNFAVTNISCSAR